jgi:hypothetical protein
VARPGRRSARSDLAGHAGYGYCASHSRYYWGFKLYLVCAGDGMPHMWCLASPKIGEREVVAALLDHNGHLIRTGQVLFADKGFAGREFKALTEAMGLCLLRPDRKDETYRNGNFGGVRQWIESVSQTLKGPTRSRSPRRPHARRRVHPDRAAPVGHGRRHLAQLDHRHRQQTITDRLRPLTPVKESSI